MARTLVSLGLVLALAGCGGGGGGAPFAGGGGGRTPVFNCTGGSEFDYAAVFSDGKTYCAYGPGMIGADAAYAKGATGAGALVAVIDTGIDATHTELDANISPDSIDIVRGDPMTDESGHGTHIAGIIAAERNGVANHGVAYDATILAIRADTRISDPAVCGGSGACSVFFDSDITAALDYAASKSANVINMSLGGPSPLNGATEQALIDAMAAGAVVVAATGNDGAAQPAYPAAYAGDAVVNAAGRMVAVGAVDDTGARAAFSNRCGSAMAFCLTAPGVDIISDQPGDNLEIASGTSQAAAFVSGAAGLLAGTWPTLTADQIVSILLITATDLGDAGVDAVYGHGLLNLDAAVAPLGDLVIPTSVSSAGGGVSLDATALSLGPAFGDALRGTPLLARALALDAFDRDYVARLDGHVIGAGRGFGLDALMTAGAIASVESALPNGATLSMAMADPAGEDPAVRWSGMAADPPAGGRLYGMSLAMAGAGDIVYTLGYDVVPAQLLLEPAAQSGASLFWMQHDLLTPQYALVGAGAAFSASRRLGENGSVTIGLVDEEADLEADGAARIAEIVVTREFSGGAALTARFSNIDERDGFLGSEADGGFAVSGANSRFYILGARLPLRGGVDLLGSYTLGRTDMAADGTSLLSDWSGVRADAFGVGIVKRDVLGTGGRVGVLAGQPLRVAGGSAMLSVPVAYQSDKTVMQASERVAVTPTGREIDVQLAFDRAIGASGDFSGWVMMQLEPGHDASAPPAYGLGLRLGVRF
ncbi:MAG: S8 family serine peptidase [Rhodospirillales bacterium]|nr:MAG: S8 family serine peptidase [Rhodospirillales bacterium]